MPRAVRHALACGLSAVAVCSAVFSLTASPAAAATPTFSWYGGPVMTSFDSHVVVWGPDVASSMTSAIPSFLNAFAGASGGAPVSGNVFSALGEYSTAGATAAASGGVAQQVIQYRQTYSGSVQISPSAGAGSVKATVDDSQIQAELAKDIDAGVLAAPTGDGTTTAYVILFPPDDTVCVDDEGAPDNCSGSNFCAYHASFAHLGYHVMYIVMPDQVTESSGCAEGPAAPTSGIDIVLSEQMEDAITDPLVAESTTLTPPVAWNSSAGEVAGSCFPAYSAEQVGTATYYVSQFFSRLRDECVGSDTFSTPHSAFSSHASGASVSFSDASTGDNRGWYSYAWNFGDGSSASGADPTHVYTSGGTYQVTETVTDDDGFSSSTTQSVAFNSPQAAFTFNAAENPVTFADASTGANGGFTRTQWAFGDGGTATGANVSHAYTAAGTYQVTETVVDADGFSSSATHAVTLGAALFPVASAALESTLISNLAKPSIVTTGAATTKTSGKSIVVAEGLKSTCPTGTLACTVVIKATVPAAAAAAAMPARKGAAEPVTIANSKHVLAPGASIALVVKLNARGTALLRRKGKLTATMTVTVTQGGASPVTRVRTVTLRLP